MYTNEATALIPRVMKSPALKFLFESLAKLGIIITMKLDTQEAVIRIRKKFL